MRSVAPRLPFDAIEKTKALIAASLPNPDRPDEAIPEHGLQSLFPVDAAEGAVVLAVAWEAVVALTVCCHAGVVVQGGEVAFVAVLSAVVAAVVGWGYVPCRYLAVFRLLEGALCHYTRSRPPSVRKYFPTQMRCASLAARSTFGCFSGFKYGRRAERNCIVWLLLS